MKTGLTTPDIVTFLNNMAGLKRMGMSHVAYEASSHGLDQHRCEGVPLAAAAFTNFSRDHLDYHETMDAYFEAKMRLFEELLPPGKPAVIWTDDPKSDEVIERAQRARPRAPDRRPQGRDDPPGRADADRARPDAACSSMAARAIALALPLIGAYQAANVLTAAGLVLATGGEWDATFSAMQRVAPVRGRLERAVISRAGVPVYIDYAHTPDALEAAIAALRPHVEGRLITVFGAGGDRDQGKRPEMGAVATALVRHRDRHRRQSAQRGSGARSAPRSWPARRGATEVAGPPRSDRRSDPHRARRATSCSSPARATRPARSSATGAAVRRCAGRAGVRGVSALWTSDEIAAATGGTASAPFEVTGVTFDSREVGPGDLFVAMPGTVHDGHKFVDAAFAAGAAGAIVSQPVSGPHVLVDDTFAALQALGRASRERSQRDDLRRHRFGRQDQHQGSALRRARPQPAGQGPSLREELQQPYRRAAQPGADAARRRVRGVRNGHEQCRRDPRADARRCARMSR